MNELDVKPILESLFFVSDSPIRFEVLVEILPESSKEDILEGIRRIQAEYGDPSKGIELAEIAGGYQFRTKPGWAEWVNRLKKTKAVKLSQAALETLAIVAYRQPVIRPTIEEIRGVDSGSVLHTLMERGLIKMMGRKDLPGRPIVYGTSKAFLELFSLSSLSDLPKLQEIQPPPAPEEISAQEISPQETSPQEARLQETSQETSPQEISPQEISNEETLKTQTDEVTAEDPLIQPPPPQREEGEGGQN
jgi:segregation and condensation protein B